MKTTEYPVWKTILKGIGWLIGILAYGVLVTLGSADILNSNIFIAAAVCIVLLALPGAALIESGHRTAGWVLVGMALMPLVRFITLALSPFLHSYPGNPSLGGP